VLGSLLISSCASPTRGLTRGDMICQSIDGELICNDNVVTESIPTGLPSGYVCMSEGRISEIFRSCVKNEI